MVSSEKKASGKKTLKKVLKGSAIAIIIFITISMIATKLIYDSIFQRYDSDINKQPEALEELKATKTITYQSGENTLTGYLYKSPKESDSLIVLVGGFQSEVLEYTDVIRKFTASGFDVFSFDSTGHGTSEGDSAVGFPQIISDLNATLDYIENSDEFKYQDIFLFGHSRGGYGVCCVMGEHKSISAVISVNGVDKAMDGIMAGSVDSVGKLAYSNYPFLWAYQSMLFGKDLADRSAVERINKSNIPVLIIQSENDERIPKDFFSLYSHKDEINSENAEFMLYNSPDKDGHTSILYDDKGNANPDIIRRATAFFRKNTDQEDSSE